MRTVSRFLGRLGVLRTGLSLLALLVILTAPFARMELEMSTLGFLRSVVAPTLMVMLAFTLALDITMSRVFMLDSEGEARRRLRQIVWFEAGLLVLMLSAWTPWLSTVLIY